MQALRFLFVFFFAKNFFSLRFCKCWDFCSHFFSRKIFFRELLSTKNENNNFVSTCERPRKGCRVDFFSNCSNLRWGFLRVFLTSIFLAQLWSLCDLIFIVSTAFYLLSTTSMSTSTIFVALFVVFVLSIAYVLSVVFVLFVVFALSVISHSLFDLEGYVKIIKQVCRRNIKAKSYE